MKKERRRNSRVAVRFPVDMASVDSDVRFKVHTTDVGEGGLAVSLPRRSKLRGRWQLSFSLPGSETKMEVAAEFAWEGTGIQAGLRFQNPSAEFERQLREWLVRNSPEVEKDDPPVRCQLTDLSMGGCYLDIPSPFPVSTRVTLSMRASEVELRSEGVVRVMHPEKGMGVEFTQSTPEHRELLEKFLGRLAENPDVLPELMVEPEGLETEPGQNSRAAAQSNENVDPLLHLFRNHSGLDADAFLGELRKQRGVPVTATGASA
jgi:c-di-GMP-binding flagellar brake protein YcgR